MEIADWKGDEDGERVVRARLLERINRYAVGSNFTRPAKPGPNGRRELHLVPKFLNAGALSADDRAVPGAVICTDCIRRLVFHEPHPGVIRSCKFH